MHVDLPFSRPVKLRLDVQPAELRAEATDAERIDVARLLELQAVDALEIVATIGRDGEGFQLDGRVRARVVQTCVVTFDPVPATLDVQVRRRLVLGEPTDATQTAVDPLAEEVDYLATPTLDLGAVAFEELSLALDPYPRAPHADAALAAVETPVEGPFAALARRRSRA